MIIWTTCSKNDSLLQGGLNFPHDAQFGYSYQDFTGRFISVASRCKEFVSVDRAFYSNLKVSQGFFKTEKGMFKAW
jgi:hypothetical protein